MTEHGICSWYDAPPGALTASGEPFNPQAMTAAHNTLPFGTNVRVTVDSAQAEVRINDRGPHVAGRIIDVTPAAAAVLNLTNRGVAECTSELDRLLHFSAYYLTFPKRITGLIASSIAALTIYFFQQMYFGADLAVNRLMQQIVFERYSRNLYIFSTYKQYDIYVFTRNILWASLNTLQVSILVIDFFLMKSEVEIMNTLYCRHFEAVLTSVYGIASILVHLLQVVAFSVFIYGFAHICTLGAVHAVAQLLNLYVKCNHNFRYLFYIRHSFLWTHLYVYKIYAVQTVRFVGRFNGHMAKLFLAYLLINCPINVWMVMLLLQGHVHGMQAFFFVCLILPQFGTIFALHYVAANFGRHFHKPARLLITIYLANLNKIGHLRARMTLSGLIQTFHCRRRYGLTYGNIALITFKTFTKVKFWRFFSTTKANLFFLSSTFWST
ncbi:hypothetical protein TYRP_014022 [Tyrophagus putrescentiae]|nr:hypothetical protein TYRP_014022 [Tyrophagus putrescentiae]